MSAESNTTDKRLHLACGRTILPSWVNLDMMPGDGVDVVADVDRCSEVPLSFENDSFAEFLASQLFEHLRNPLPFMQELHGIAKPGAKAVFRVSYGSSDDAMEDPTHVRLCFLQTFGCFSQPYYWRADYGYTARESVCLISVSLTMEGRVAKGIIRTTSFGAILSDRLRCTYKHPKQWAWPRRSMASIAAEAVTRVGEGGSRCSSTVPLRQSPDGRSVQLASSVGLLGARADVQLSVSVGTREAKNPPARALGAVEGRRSGASSKMLARGQEFTRLLNSLATIVAGRIPKTVDQVHSLKTAGG